MGRAPPGPFLPTCSLTGAHLPLRTWLARCPWTAWLPLLWLADSHPSWHFGQPLLTPPLPLRLATLFNLGREVLGHSQLWGWGALNTLLSHPVPQFLHLQNGSSEFHCQRIVVKIK